MSESDTERRLWYYPNPVHKKHTCEAGPPKWYPQKEACPEDMTIAEREQLLSESVSESDDALDPVRWAVRRGPSGLEWYVCRLTLEHQDGRIEVHGHPFVPGKPKIPPKVLRALRKAGTITRAEYERFKN